MRLAALLIAGALLAGCSDARSNDAPPEAESPVATLDEVVPLVPQPTDTLHLLGPQLVLDAPTAGEPVLVPVQSSLARALENDLISRALWFYEVTSEASLSGGEARIWIRIDRQLTNPFVAPTTCAWGLYVEVRDPGGSQLGVDRPCLSDGPLVTAGDRQLVFDLAALEANVVPGSTIGVGFEANPFDAAAAGAVHVLTGTSEMDSLIRLSGLAEVPGPSA